jgi:hypothetical protein
MTHLDAIISEIKNPTCAYDICREDGRSPLKGMLHDELARIKTDRTETNDAIELALCAFLLES